MTMEPTVEQEQTTTFYWLLDMTDVWCVLEKGRKEMVKVIFETGH